MSAPKDQQQMQILSAIPVLEVADVEASIDWYREMLDFTADPFPQTPPFQFAILRQGETELMLRCGTSNVLREPQPYKWNVYLRLAGGELQDLFTRLSDRSVVSRRLERMYQAGKQRIAGRKDLACGGRFITVHWCNRPHSAENHGRIQKGVNQ